MIDRVHILTSVTICVKIFVLVLQILNEGKSAVAVKTKMNSGFHLIKL